MGAAVSVPTENIWCRWDMVFDLMKAIGRAGSCVSWDAILAALWGLWTLQGFQALTGVAWSNVKVRNEDEDVIETDKSSAREQRPSHAGKDAQSSDENGERPSSNSKPTQSCADLLEPLLTSMKDALSIDPMTLGRLAVISLEKQICKPFADKLEKGWNPEEIDAPLLELFEPRKAMEGLAIDFYNHLKQEPLADVATFIKRVTATENQSWTLNSAEECRAFRQCRRAEKALLRKEIRKGKMPLREKYCKEGANLPNDGTDPESDLAEAGL